MKKIAICDSSCDTLEAMRRILAAQYGKELQIAAYPSGRELLRAWQRDERKKADIMIMDVRQEEENGISVAKQVQEIFEHWNARKIFLRPIRSIFWQSQSSRKSCWRRWNGQ